jgi:hypothetical protein
VRISAPPRPAPSQRQRRERREKGRSEGRGTYIEEGPRLLWTNSSGGVALRYLSALVLQALTKTQTPPNSLCFPFPPHHRTLNPPLTCPPSTSSSPTQTSELKCSTLVCLSRIADLPPNGALRHWMRHAHRARASASIYPPRTRFSGLWIPPLWLQHTAASSYHSSMPNLVAHPLMLDLSTNAPPDCIC